MTTAEKLAEAESALHKLNTGQSVAEFVDQNGERVRFTAANRSALRSYIAELTSQISGLGTPGGSIGFFF